MYKKASHTATKVFRAMENFEPAPFNEVSTELNRAAVMTAIYLDNKKKVKHESCSTKTTIAHAG